MSKAISKALNYAVTCPGQGFVRHGLLLPYKSLQGYFQQELNIINETLGEKFSQKLFDTTDQNWLLKTSNAQPAILSTTYIIYKIIERKYGIDLTSDAKFILGHSLGEYTALLLAGVIDFPSAINLVRKRGQLMEAIVADSPVGANYGMVACLVGNQTNSDKVIETAKQHNILGNINSVRQIVLSGEISKIKQVMDELNTSKRIILKQVLLPVEIPFHSSILSEVGSQLWPQDGAILTQKVPIISNLTGEPSYDSISTLENTLRCNHEPVQWEKSMQYLQDEGIDHIINLGPGTVLSGLNKTRKFTNVNLDLPESFSSISALESTT